MTPKLRAQCSLVGRACEAAGAAGHAPRALAMTGANPGGAEGDPAA